MPLEKICKQCKELKKAHLFSKITSRYKGKVTLYLSSYCKECASSKFRSKYVPIPRRPRLRIANYLYFKDAKKTERPTTALWPTRPSYIEKHYEYPTCTECGFKYIKRCLLCKYGHPKTAKIS